MFVSPLLPSFSSFFPLPRPYRLPSRAFEADGLVPFLCVRLRRHPRIPVRPSLSLNPSLPGRPKHSLTPPSFLSLPSLSPRFLRPPCYRTHLAYRHVTLPKQLVKFLPPGIATEDEWRGCGIRQVSLTSSSTSPPTARTTVPSRMLTLFTPWIA